MAEDLLALAAELGRRGKRSRWPRWCGASGRPRPSPAPRPSCGPDGSITGWVGGACAEPVVVREALKALRDGQPRFVGLVGEGRATPGRTEGISEYPMTCHSGGTLEIYVEPYLPEARCSCSSVTVRWSKRSRHSGVAPATGSWRFPRTRWRKASRAST